MSDFRERIEKLSPQRLKLLALELNSRLTALDRERTEPIAIVGAGCRIPEAEVGSDSFWNLLRAGTDAVAQVPLNRWDAYSWYDSGPDAPGRSSTTWGGFVSGVDLFDASFFNISAREAAHMDPQQRILLESCWEALENAGLSPRSLRGSPTGVFIGFTNNDYHPMLLARGEEFLDTYVATGASPSIAAGRISYFLGFNGPALTLDTACSASLVSVHLACQSLRQGECNLALAGGVNLILSPEITVTLSKAHMMAPDGHSKSFDARANGFVRGEGCGVVVLKRLSDAKRDGDRILAVIRGSAVNQDGRSSGLTAPNGVAQEALLRQALSNAGLTANDIDYIEAHGTGTSLGDPIEAHALAAVFGQEREPSHPLVIGSVKTNIGHLEAAAGVAGLIKTVLSLEHEYIPQHLHFRSMNPHIDWGNLEVEIPVEGRAWPRGQRVRRAGVSSFGFSGTNAHVIVEEAPLPEPRQAEWHREWHVLALSARTTTALEELTERYRQELSESRAELGDICFTANAGRTHFEERTFYPGKDREQMLAAMRQPAVRGRKEATPPVAFLFSGQGSQYAGMGRELYESQPVFRQALDRCAELLSGELEEPLLEVLWGSQSQLLGQTQYTQPGLFSLEWSLAELWRSWGVEPAMVAGHSVGEYVAATVAGVMTLESGLKLIAARGRLMQGCSGEGVMLAVRSSVERVQAGLRGLESRVSLGGVNAPESVVISGYRQEVEQVEQRLRAQGVECKRLAVSHGFHSPQMEEMEEAFERIASGLEYRAPSVEWISTLTGELVGSAGVDAGYWRRQVRQPVQWAQAMAAMERRSAAIYLEVGPGTTLLGLGKQCVETAERLWAPSLRSTRAEWEQILDSLGRIYVRGVDIDWSKFDAPYQRRRVALPTYPFQRQHYWIEADGPSVLRADPESEWASIQESVARQADQGGLNLDIASYPERWAALSLLTAEYISRAFYDLDLYQTSGERHSAESLVVSRGILTIYQNLMHRWLRHLAANGLLCVEGDWYTAISPLRPRTLESLCNLDRLFSNDPIFEYFSACGPVLADVVTGKLSAVETLFPRGDFSRAEGVYERHPMSAYFASLARAALEGLLRSRAGSSLRIVEIGGGTGATASVLLPILRGQDATYHFTDVSAAFLRHAERKFAAYPFVRYQQLDIEQDCTLQNFLPGSFDVVVATNVLHATADIRKTLERATSLLAAGGLLIVCEVTESYAWLETTEALMPGWQAFEDDLRGDNPLLPQAVWSRLFSETKLEQFAAFPAEGSPAKILGQHVFVARAPGMAGSDHGSRRRIGGNVTSSATVTRDAPQELVLFDVPAAERHGVLVDLIRRLLAEMLRFDSPERLDGKRRFTELGVDSLIAVEIRHQLHSSLRLEQPLSATVVFDYPTIDSLANHLEHDVLNAGGSREPQAAAFPEVAAGMTARAEELARLDESDVEALLLSKLESL